MQKKMKKLAWKLKKFLTNFEVFLENLDSGFSWTRLINVEIFLRKQNLAIYFREKNYRKTIKAGDLSTFQPWVVFFLKKSQRLRKLWKVAPSPPWSAPYIFWLLKLRRTHHGREELFHGRVVSAFVWKVAPSPPWSGKSRRSRLSLESRAVFTLKAKFAPHLLRWRRIDSWSRRLCLGLESRSVSASVWKVTPSPSRSRNFWNRNFWSRWPGRSRRYFLSRAFSWVAEALKNFFLVAPSPCWSGKSCSLHLALESLEMAELGRAGRAVSWDAGSCRIHFSRESRAWVFWSQKSASVKSWRVWTYQIRVAMFWSRHFHFGRESRHGSSW